MNLDKLKEVRLPLKTFIYFLILGFTTFSFLPWLSGPASAAGDCKSDFDAAPLQFTSGTYPAITLHNLPAKDSNNRPLYYRLVATRDTGYGIAPGQDFYVPSSGSTPPGLQPSGKDNEVTFNMGKEVLGDTPPSGSLTMVLHYIDQSHLSEWSQKVGSSSDDKTSCQLTFQIGGNNNDCQMFFGPTENNDGKTVHEDWGLTFTLNNLQDGGYLLGFLKGSQGAINLSPDKVLANVNVNKGNVQFIVGGKSVSIIPPIGITSDNGASVFLYTNWVKSDLFCKTSIVVKATDGKPEPQYKTPSQGGSPGMNCSGSNCSSSAGQTCDPTNGTAGGTGGIMTAIGCVPTSINQLIPAILRVALLAAGGIALLLMAIGALGMVLSNGNPEALKNSRARFTSAIVGLVFIIFSVLLLKIIGVDLLGLNVFGGS